MLTDIFAHNSPPKGKIIFYLQNNTSIDFPCLIRKIGSVVSYFSGLKTAKGERAAIFLENSIDYIVSLIALFDLDIVIIPLNTRLNRDKVAYFLKHSQSRFFITSSEMLVKNPWINELNCRTVLTDEICSGSSDRKKTYRSNVKSHSKSKDIKFIIYTSGTIGSPKGVMLSKGAIEHKISCLSKSLKLGPSSSFFSFLPFFSGHGMIPGMLVPLLSGCRIFIGRFDPFLAFNFWELIKKYKINHFTSVPSILSVLKENIKNVRRQDVRHLCTVFSASAPLPQDIYDWYRDHLGINIRNCYGLTETASWVSVNMEGNKAGGANCVGRPFCAQIRAFDKKGHQLGHNHTGELWIKSRSNMLGYYKNKKATKSSIAPGNFVKSGDLGYIDRRGKVFILDRIKHMIIRNGINIYPLEIDQVFLKHGHVKNSISFGVPDKNYGERVVTALIVRDGERSKDRYFRYAIDKLPSTLVPNDIFFVSDFPRGPTGKAIIASLQKQYLKER